MDIQEVCDRAEIADVIVRYTRVVDRQDWDQLDTVFTADARIDYSAFGGISGDLGRVREFLAESMRFFTSTQHMLGLPAITIDGDRARAVTPCHNPMLMGTGADARVMVCSLWYHHELVRTPHGWRICSLSEERNFMTMPPGGDITSPTRQP
ncbi:MAG TPA: nuclear transport factor 2 family protein [Acidimicrobiales bacterium]|nr:nuclear transport factor 2 family protein [Acidimicrobiales bacterium]